MFDSIKSFPDDVTYFPIPSLNTLGKHGLRLVYPELFTLVRQQSTISRFEDDISLGRTKRTIEDVRSYQIELRLENMR